VVFHEKFGLLRLSGMLMVVAGIAVMLFSRRSRTLSKVAQA
jgi:O-acetylserine/cysteine efflux transporter